MGNSLLQQIPIESSCKKGREKKKNKEHASACLMPLIKTSGDTETWESQWKSMHCSSYLISLCVSDWACLKNILSDMPSFSILSNQFWGNSSLELFIA